MKIVALSDLHGMLPKSIPECDLLLIGGDFTPVSNHGLNFQQTWLDGEFRSWLKRLPARKIVGVAGNHDLIFEHAPEKVPTDLPWTYLEDSGSSWEGFNIWGSPWQPWFWDWAFNGNQDVLRSKWDLIPSETDILVLHGPPHGYGDGVPEAEGIRRCGCPFLLDKIKEIEPQLVIFGHIHEGRGDWQLGKTRLANVTQVDERYRNIYPPFVIELDSPKSRL